MTQEMQGPAEAGAMTTPQGTPDPRASGLGGTPRGGAGPELGEVARKAPSRRAAGAGAKQPTKRKSAKQKAKREAASASAKPAAKKSARKVAATKNTAAKRAVKSGATRRRVHQQH
jgi:hypothetical protein